MTRSEQVSIHAPAWGATSSNAASCSRGDRVSIHAPAWGATCAVPSRRSGMSGFQSTPPRGGRRGRERDRRCCAGRFQSTPPRGGRQPVRYDDAQAATVSIHAPAWGATPALSFHRPGSIWFQSTPPRGGRPNVGPMRHSPAMGFNPRPRVGGDAHRPRSLNVRV